MNHPGEIDALARVAQPTVALVNNAQREHLEFMQTVQAVAEENGAVLGVLASSGTAVFPADDAFTPLWTELAEPRRVVRFASQATAQTNDLVCNAAEWADGAWTVSAQGLGQTLNFRLHIAGRHNVKNALAAAACALSAGVPVASVVQGLETFVPVKGRSRALVLALPDRTRTLVDDTYNANPDSVRAAIAVLAELPAPRLLVLGDMGEVGEQGPAFHAEAGAEAKAAGIEHFYATGELARFAVAAFPGAQHFESIDALQAAVQQCLPQVNSVLVKGSRFMKMERVIEAINACHDHNKRTPRHAADPGPMAANPLARAWLFPCVSVHHVSCRDGGADRVVDWLDRRPRCHSRFGRFENWSTHSRVRDGNALV